MKLTLPRSFVSLQLRLSLLQNCSTVVYRVSSHASGLQTVAANTTMIRSLNFRATCYDRTLKHLAFQDCGDWSPNTRVSKVPSSTFENPSAIFSTPILRHIPDWSPRIPQPGSLSSRPLVRTHRMDRTLMPPSDLSPSYPTTALGHNAHPYESHPPPDAYLMLGDDMVGKSFEKEFY